MKTKRFFLKTGFLSLCFAGSFAAVHAQGVDLEWVHSISSSGDDAGKAVFTDASGNLYTAGSFSDIIDFDPGPAVVNLSSAGEIDIFISKVDATGNLVWAKRMGGTGQEEGSSIAVDAAGNVYTAGYFTGSADFNPSGSQGMRASNGDMDIFITKHDAGGNFLWVKTVGGSGLDRATGITLDNMDGVYVTGQFEGSVNFEPGGNQTVTTSGGSDAFVCKLNASGSLSWVKSFSGNSTGIGQAIALDNARNVYTTGSFKGTVDFDPGTGSVSLVANGTQDLEDIFISKLDTAGNFVWAKQIGGTESDVAYSLALDPWNNVIVAGMFAGTVDFDPGTGVYNLASTMNTLLNLSTFPDGFVLKLNADGDFIWVKQLGGEQMDEIKSVQSDAKGNLYTTGFFDGVGSFGSYTLTAENGIWVPDIFIAKMDTAGTFVWAKAMGGPGPDCGWGVACSSGNVYTTGVFYSDVDFDPGVGVNIVNGIDGSDIFIHKMICTDTSSSNLNIEACNSYMFDEEMLNASGTYVHVIPNNSGCDSTVTLNLTILTIDHAVIQKNGAELTTTQNYATYQWLKDGAILSGSNAANYAVTANGDYQVIVSNAIGCTDTSAVFTVDDVTGVVTPELISQIYIFPNPASDQINIKSPVSVNVSIYSIDGRKLQQVENVHKISLEHLDAGIYFLHLEGMNGHLLKVEKMIKQ